MSPRQYVWTSTVCERGPRRPETLSRAATAMLKIVQSESLNGIVCLRAGFHETMARWGTNPAGMAR